MICLHFPRANLAVLGVFWCTLVHNDWKTISNTIHTIPCHIIQYYVISCNTILITHETSWNYIFESTIQVLLAIVNVKEYNISSVEELLRKPGT